MRRKKTVAVTTAALVLLAKAMAEDGQRSAKGCRRKSRNPRFARRR